TRAPLQADSKRDKNTGGRWKRVAWHAAHSRLSQYYTTRVRLWSGRHERPIFGEEQASRRVDSTPGNLGGSSGARGPILVVLRRRRWGPTTRPRRAHRRPGPGGTGGKSFAFCPGAFGPAAPPRLSFGEHPHDRRVRASDLRRCFPALVSSVAVGA